MRSVLPNIYSLSDLERRARGYLPRAIFSFVAAGAETESSIAGNRAAYDLWQFVPRTLVDVSATSPATELFGEVYAAPFGIAPIGGAAMTAFEADLAMASGAERRAIPFVLSGASTEPVENIMRAAPRAWFQAYLSHDQSRTEALLDRLISAKVGVLVVTTDVPVMGNRDNAQRAGFTMPPKLTPRLVMDGLMHPRWLARVVAQTALRRGVPYQENFDSGRGESILARKVSVAARRGRFSWEHIDHIRSRWPGKLLLKGSLSPVDGRLAADHGVDGLILSNHGGRQLDDTIAPLTILPDMLEAVPGLPLIVDGGITRGSQVLKAVALGARMVLVGRPFLYASALGGASGVADAADILIAEIARNLSLLGSPAIASLNRDFLRPASPARFHAGEEPSQPALRGRSPGTPVVRKSA